MSFLRNLMRTDELTTVTLWSSLLAEFVGTLFLIGTLAFTAESEDVSTPLAMGFTLMVLIQVFGDYGGCFINPCVTLCQLLVGKCSLLRALLYVCAQVPGALAGVYLVRGLTSDASGRSCLFQVAEGISPAQGFGVEVWFTFLLNIGILAASNSSRKSPVNPNVLIGVALSVGGFCAGPLTGGSFNPALSLAVAVSCSDFKDIWLTVVGPFVGASVAGITFLIFECLTPNNGEITVTKASFEVDNEAYVGAAELPVTMVSQRF